MIYNKLLSLLKDYWKYILVFLIGLAIPFLMETSAGKLVRNYFEEKAKSEAKIRKYEKEIAFQEGKIFELIKYRTDAELKSAMTIKERDSLKVLILKQDTILKSIDTKGFQELDKIKNYSDKELYEFFKNLHK